MKWKMPLLQSGGVRTGKSSLLPKLVKYKLKFNIIPKYYITTLESTVKTNIVQILKLI